MQTYDEQVTKKCPFPDCDWSRDYFVDEMGEIIDDTDAVIHYEREHAGKIRVQVTIEYEQLMAGRTPKEIRERQMERYEKKGENVAHVRTEVLREQDDHSVLEGDD